MRPVLPARLQETLQLLAEGYTDQQIADRLFLTLNGVKKRTAALYRTIGARNRLHAVTIGFAVGVISTAGVPVPACVVADDVPVEQLVEARLDRGVTRQQMAVMLGVSATWLGVRESGLRPFPWRLVHRYARIVGVDLDAASALEVAA